MKKRRKIIISLAAIAAAGVLGMTAYGTENEQKQDSGRITLDSAIDVDANTTLDSASFNSEEGLEIEEVPVQEEAQASIPNIKKVAADVMPAIVAITNVGVEKMDFFGRHYEFDSESSGSGIIVAKSDTELLIATNNHVVDGAEDLTICFSVTMDDPEDEDEKLVSAQVKGTNSALDLAIVAVKLEDISEEVADKIAIVQMGDSDSVEVGEWAVAIGNALGYGQSVTFGIISALDREVSVNTTKGVVTNKMLQTDAAINGGNSGGALLDMEGRLIGINSAKASATGVEGMGYAIPINSAKETIEELMNQTTRTKVDEDKAGALGVVPVDVSEEAIQIYNIPTGAFVYQLTDNSAAEKAGIRQGDIITKLEQTSISSKAELLERMKYYEAGETIIVTVKRAGENGYEERELEVTLGKKSDLPTSAEEETEVYDDSYRERPQEEYYGYDDGYGDYFGGFDDFFFGF